MTDEQLQKSIILLGPSCVGKSLLAGELSTRLNIPKINIDDLIAIIELEQNGYLDATAEKQKKYVENTINEILNYPDLRETLIDEKYVETEKRLITNIVDLYNYYHDMLGDFKPFYDIITKHDHVLNHVKYCNESICYLNHVTNELLSIILSIVNQPVIIDPPASFGWQATNSLDFATKLRLKRSILHLDAEKCEVIMNDILSKSQTVLLVPGLDYKFRNAFKEINANNLILEHLDNYYCANIEISTNGLFNSPDNKYLKQRTWLDAREVLVKEQLKNNSEISNICDQVLISLEELHTSQNTLG